MNDLLNHFNLSPLHPGTFSEQWIAEANSSSLASYSPVDGSKIGEIQTTSKESYEKVVLKSLETFDRWQSYPAPKRGEIIREIANEFRKHKAELSKLISWEMGKILPEGEGEVQEIIDIADFAVGLSRQLYGNTMHSERPNHRMYEQWHPLGVVGVVTAFNFPAAVWAWNAMLAAICGNTILWKPSELTPFTSLAVTQICAKVAAKHGFAGLFSLVTDCDASIGKQLAADKRVPLISATGSCKMGRALGETVAKRLGRTLLELGGNNALIVLGDANIELAIRAVVFGAIGTAGQRCTTTRRLLLEESIADSFIKRLSEAYKQISIGNPLEKGILMGPLVHKTAVTQYSTAIELAKKQGGEIIYGAKVLSDKGSDCYVEPTIIRAKKEMAIVQEETFAPIIYAISVKDLDEAIAIQNNVPQGLSSSLFTSSLQSSEKFLSHKGSDCGIANINIGTSGAEIGGAFGGEKDTGGGREAGSDSWKAYMRRQTNTINWSDELPLSQGISFA